MAYYRWDITKRKGTGGSYFEASELLFYNSDMQKIPWKIKSCSASLSQASSGEGIAKLFDGSYSTKYCTTGWGSSATGRCIINFEVDDSSEFPAYYSYVTGSDAVYKDPVTWTLSYSKDGEKYIVIGDVSDAAITNSRSSETQKFAVVAPVYNVYLVQDDTTIYTIADGVLKDLETTEITADLFRTYGTEDPPTSEILLKLINPKVIAWNDEKQTEFTATVTATPYPQTIYSPDYDMTDHTILGIETVIVEASDDVTFAVSFDTGETWKHYTGTEWATLSEETSGMSAETIMAVPTDKWAEAATTGIFKIRATLPSIESTLSSVIVDYLNA